MKKKLYTIIIFILLFGALLSQNSFAKYIIQDTLQMSVYIDKTPPTINIITNGERESFTKTPTDIIKRTQEITVNTDDNIKIKTNEIYYNPTSQNFEKITSNNFDEDVKITDEGFYKIVATDTSNNKTEIVILLDKSAPEVVVKYYKKGEETAKLNETEVRQVAVIKKNLSSEQVINAPKEENNIMEINEDYEPKAVFAARAGSITVSNETDLRNAINNQYTDIITWGSISISSTLYINHNVKIHPATNENALQYQGYGNFIVVQSNGVLDLTSMVVDTNGGAKNRGVTSINIQSGGRVIFNESSIVDGGNGNTGILVNGGATLLLNSCHIANSTKGVVVKDNGVLSFGNLSNGRNNEFWGDNTAISFENFTGTCNFNQNNIKIKDNVNGIVTNSSSGTINISNVEIFNNSSAGIDLGNGKLNITGGTIRNNKVGIYLNTNNSGKLKISNVNIHSNSQYAINHCKNVDGSCTILGGSISGAIYLGQNDNYINTNSSYPTFTVTPSTYYFKRKLVKTNSNAIANTEISKVTLTPKDSWYKYVENNEYIVLWTGGNVIARYKDYFGNILKQELKNGSIGSEYSITPPIIPGYDLIYIPANSKGTYTQSDITVDFKYDLVNVAKVNFEDLLSNVVSAKYWFNEDSEAFTGNGTDFANGTTFEDYGYYKVLVVNGVGLEKELTFSLNKDSLKR